MKFSVSLLSVRIPVAADPGIQKFVTDFYPPGSQASCSELSSPSFAHLPLCSPVYIVLSEGNVDGHTIYDNNIQRIACVTDSLHRRYGIYRGFEPQAITRKQEKKHIISLDS